MNIEMSRFGFLVLSIVAVSRVNCGNAALGSIHRYLRASTSNVRSYSIRSLFVWPESSEPDNSYYKQSDAEVLGHVNYDVTLGNPLKGLLTSPWWTESETDGAVPASLDFHYIGMDDVMRDWNSFDWSHLDNTLENAARRSRHVIWRVYCHYPGQQLRLPQFLVDEGVPIVETADGVSPQYDDPLLLQAFEQLIQALGHRYDGHRSIGFIQLGLLGKWGEWHTYPDKGLLSEGTKEKVATWYMESFSQTKLQMRVPMALANKEGVGLHDDSFAFSTLDGAENGGQHVSWFFWPTVKKEQQNTFWRNAVMGGETRPELQSTVFTQSYEPGAPFQQDFMKCVETTHATYILHHTLFQNRKYDQLEIKNARFAHVRMGYNFQVTQVSAEAMDNSGISLRVAVKQIGEAPFYYPLKLKVSCDGFSAMADGVNEIIGNGDEKGFLFDQVPSTHSCLSDVEISLSSDFIYNDRPIKFAQGEDGRVRLSIPLPGEEQKYQDNRNKKIPSPSPSLPPGQSPSESPSLLPSPFPSPLPSLAPSQKPSTRSPSFAPSASQSVLMTSLASSTDVPSDFPSTTPTVSCNPSVYPSELPSHSISPSFAPSGRPSLNPSFAPSGRPSLNPSGSPSASPSTIPSVRASYHPSGWPIARRMGCYSSPPSEVPSDVPSSQPNTLFDSDSIPPNNVPSLSPSPTSWVPPSGGHSHGTTHGGGYGGHGTTHGGGYGGHVHGTTAHGGGYGHGTTVHGGGYGGHGGGYGGHGHGTTTSSHGGGYGGGGYGGHGHGTPTSLGGWL